MKLRKTLYINNEPVKLVEDDTTLSLYSPGRAVFQVQSAAPLAGLVRLEVGYTSQDKDQVFFIGVIRDSQTVDTGQQRLRCRELTCVLYNQLHAALRHPTLPEVLQWYTDNTGLRFVVPERAYAKKRVPAFGTLGNGFHGLNALGGIFGIENYIWQQQGDGSVFAGAWEDSRWATRPVAIPESRFTKVTATGGQGKPGHAPTAARRPPERAIPGRSPVDRPQDGDHMRKLLEKIVLKIFPELSGGMHLPRFARVLAVNDAPADGGASERFRPRYAVDFEVLTPDGEVDKAYPVYEAVPLPVPVGCGQEAGLFGFPEPGTLIEIGFAYGRPDLPIVRQIYPQGLNLPRVAMGEQRWQQSPGVAQAVDQDGNWTRQTDGAITDESLRRVTRAVENLDEFSRELRTIHEHSTEKVGGNKIIEAMGALRLRSGASANLVAVDNINLTTARDYTLTAAQDRHEVAGRHHVALVKGNKEETVVGNRTEDVGGNRTESTGGNISADVGGESSELVGKTKSIQAEHIALQAQTISFTNTDGSISFLGLLVDFMEEARCALHDLAMHTHPAVGSAPANSGHIDHPRGKCGWAEGEIGDD